MTDSRGELVVRCESGIVKFPDMWALMDIRERFILGSDSFEVEGFKAAIESAGYKVKGKSYPQSIKSAEKVWTEMYAALTAQDETGQNRKRWKWKGIKFTRKES